MKANVWIVIGVTVALGSCDLLLEDQPDADSRGIVGHRGGFFTHTGDVAAAFAQSAASVAGAREGHAARQTEGAPTDAGARAGCAEPKPAAGPTNSRSRRGSPPAPSPLMACVGPMP